MTPAYKAYLKQVRRALCCSAADRRRLVAGLEQELLEAFPNAEAISMRELAEQFGTPGAMAQELQQALPGGGADIARRRMLRVWLCFLVCLLFTVLAACGIVWWEHRKAANTPPEVVVIQPPPEIIYVQPGSSVAERPGPPIEERPPEDFSGAG